MLEAAAREAVAGRQVWTALRHLDRLHRIGGGSTGTLLLQASCHRALGHVRHTSDLLRAAHARSPLDPTVQRAILQIEREGASGLLTPALAAAWLGVSAHVDIIAATMSRSENVAFCGTVDRQDGRLQGLVVWRGDTPRRTLRWEGPEGRGSLDVEGRPWDGGRGLFTCNLHLPAWSDGHLDLFDALTGERLRPGPGMPPATDPPFTLDLRPGSIAIVIPVFDQVECLMRCLDNLHDDGCTLARDIVLIDDASQQPETRAYLAEAGRHSDVHILANPRNLGFARTINRALPALQGHTVVLLNSDTVCPPQWLERLMTAAAGEKVGTVTPVSNSGEILSVPYLFENSPLGGDDDVRERDRLFRRHALPDFQIPHGIGYCMLMTPAALAAVKTFDTRFGRGYFEDVDFGMRVHQAGLKNICCPTVYVGHASGSSFGIHRQPLIARNAELVRAKWPELDGLTDALLDRDPLSALRDRLLIHEIMDSGRSALLLSSRLDEPWIWSEATAAVPKKRMLGCDLQADGRAYIRLRPDGPAVSVTVDTLFRRNGEPSIVCDGFEPVSDAVARLPVAKGVTVLLTATGTVARHSPSAAAIKLFAPRGSQIPLGSLGESDLRYYDSPHPAPQRGRLQADPSRWRCPAVYSTLPKNLADRHLGGILRSLSGGRAALVYLGRLPGDQMQPIDGNIVASGPVAPTDIERALLVNRCDGLLIIEDESCLAHPIFSFAQGLPVPSSRLGPPLR